MQSVILSQSVHGAKAVKRNKDLDISGPHEQVCLSDCCWQTCGSLRQWNSLFSSAVSFSMNFPHCQIMLSRDRKTNNCTAWWKRGQWGASHKRLSHSLRCHSHFHRALLHTSLMWRHADISLYTRLRMSVCLCIYQFRCVTPPLFQGLFLNLACLVLSNTIDFWT